jgi:hypothetical protein
LRVADAKGESDLADVANLLAVLAIRDVEPAIAILAEFFPKTAQDADKQRFVLKRILSMENPPHAPRYPDRSDPADC